MEMVSALEVCLEVTQKIEGCSSKMCAMEEQIETFDSEIAKYEEKINPTIIMRIRYSISYALMAFVILMFLFIKIGDQIAYNIPMSDSTVYAIFNGMVIVAGILSILFSILCTFLLKKRNKKKQQEVMHYKANMEQSLANLEQPLRELINSPENELCKNLIPPDYKKSAIIEKFIYFFRNGHVTTMQEAVVAYDKFRHEKKMEHYAYEAADNARIAANNTASIANSTASMQKSLNELEAIAAYNTYLNMKNNS